MTRTGDSVADEAEERFLPTSGRFSGAAGIAVAAVIVGVGVADGAGVRVSWIPVGLLVGLLSWTMSLRPRVSIAGDELVLRQPFSTQVVPLAAVEAVTVGRVLDCRVRGKRYVSAAIGRTPREAMRDRAQPAGAIVQRSYGDFVERRIGEHVDEARRRVGDADPGEVRRTWAWPEIGATVVGAVALVVTLLL